MAAVTALRVGVIVGDPPFRYDHGFHDVGRGGHDFVAAGRGVVSTVIFVMTIRKQLIVTGSLKFAVGTIG